MRPRLFTVAVDVDRLKWSEEAMQYILFLLFSFSGRISRGGFWLGLLLIGVLAFVGMAVVQPEIFDLELETPPPPSFAANVWGLMLLVPSMAITIKRLNDRNWPNWLGFLVFLAVLPLYIGPFFGLFWDFENPTTFEVAVSILIIALGIFLLVDNGFLRGDHGDNRYGPDPLAKTT